MGKKYKKFRPVKNCRMLPGSVSEEVCINDLYVYNLHRYKVFTATAMVDDKPLKMNPYNYINARKLSEDVFRLRVIDMENKDLLKKINWINRRGGLVDTYNPIAYRRMSKWDAYTKRMQAIERDNKLLYKAIINTSSYYQNKMYSEFWTEMTGRIKHSCKFPSVLLKKLSMDDVLRAQPSISGGLEQGHVERPLCFLKFQVRNGEYLGCMVIELYYDHVPVTVQNFLEICKGEDLTYKNCLVHRIVKGQFLETGDITKGNGKGGFSIYGKSFPEENHMLSHTKAGVVSMKRIAPQENNSQFCITFAKMDQLDHKNVVFGKVIRGNDILFKIQDFGRKIGKPYADIIISDCGVIPKCPSV